MEAKAVLAAACCLIASVAHAQGNGNGGNSVRELEARVTLLEAEVAELKAGAGPRLNAVDSAGKIIGAVQGITLELASPPLHSPVVLIPVAGELVPVGVRRDRFVGVLDGGSGFMFALPDCTGPAAFPSPRNPVRPALPPAKVFGPLQTLYYVDFDAGSIPAFAFQSSVTGDGRCVADVGELTAAIPVVQGPNLLEMFSPPFTIRQ